MSKVFGAIGPDGYGPYSIDLTGTSPHFSLGEAPIDGYFIPGFVDNHIHGGFGIDFLSASSDKIVDLCERLAGDGYEGLLPTTVTASISEIRDFIHRLPEHPMILGFHLEGPFISPKYPGAQPPNFIIEPPVGPSDWDFVLDHPKLKVITLAPELDGAESLVQRLARRSVRVGLGHTAATYEQAKNGFEAGATHTTHTFNAMRPLHHREAGAVGFALTEDYLACELIYDRLHVVPQAASLLFKNKPTDKVVAVSDGTMAAGLAAGTKLKMWNLDVEVGQGDVRLADGTLAGSAINLLDAFKNLATDFGVETAIRATSLNPRHLLGLKYDPKVYIEMDLDFNLKKRHALTQDGWVTEKI